MSRLGQHQWIYTQEEAKPRMDLSSPKPAMSAPPRTDGGAFIFTPARLVLATAGASAQGPLQRLHSPVARMLAEFRRALAAEWRHQELKQGPTAKGDISRRVYEEFYSGTSAGLNGAG